MFVCRLAAALSIILAVMDIPSAGGGEVDHAREYRACMALAQRQPEEAFESAIAWRDLGGGKAADHCAATALMGLAIYDEAAHRFEVLADTIRADQRFKAKLLGHAAQAWILAGKADRAVAILGAVPDDVDLLIDRAAALAAQDAYSPAILDLNRAIEIDPARPDAFVFRASARRFLDRPARALTDVERALELDPQHADGLLERGILRRLDGDGDGARQDWLAVIDHAPARPPPVPP